MSLGMHVNRHAMPLAIRRGATVVEVAAKKSKDPRFEGRFRAHVRRQMERLGWGPSMVAERTGFDQGYISNWLLEKRGTRGASALFLLQMCAGLDLDPLQVFKSDPDERFWRRYVPRKRDEDAGPAPSESAQTTGPTLLAAEPSAPYPRRRKPR